MNRKFVIGGVVVAFAVFVAAYLASHGRKVPAWLSDTLPAPDNLRR